jgi:hypothetical protein
MKTPLLALFAAASVALAAATATNNKKPAGPTPPGGNKTAAADKKSKKEAKAEAPVAAPEVPAEPVPLVVQSVDATTQLALAAAKVAQAEADRLAAIGTGKPAGGVTNAKLAGAVVGAGGAVAGELSKPKKEPGFDEKPAVRKPDPKPATKAEKKPAGEKPKPVSAL